MREIVIEKNHMKTDVTTFRRNCVFFNQIYSKNKLKKTLFKWKAWNKLISLWRPGKTFCRVCWTFGLWNQKERGPFKTVQDYVWFSARSHFFPFCKMCIPFCRENIFFPRKILLQNYEEDRPSFLFLLKTYGKNSEKIWLIFIDIYENVHLGKFIPPPSPVY